LQQPLGLLNRIGRSLPIRRREPGQ